MSKHTPPGERRRLVELWRASNSSKAVFARAHGVKPVTFASWVGRYGREGQVVARPPQFVQVVVAAPSGLGVPPRGFPIGVGAHELRFDTPPPTAWFAALLRELAPC